MAVSEAEIEQLVHKVEEVAQNFPDEVLANEALRGRAREGLIKLSLRFETAVDTSQRIGWDVRYHRVEPIGIF